MKWKLPLAIFSLAMTILACQKDNDGPNDDSITGSYVGTFVRTGMDTASVELTIENNHFEGSSDMEKYPAICSGSYELTGSTINFNDTCTWTADFDWSLILDGAYSIDKNGDELKITRTTGAVTDEYRLIPIVR